MCVSGRVVGGRNATMEGADGYYVATRYRGSCKIKIEKIKARHTSAVVTVPRTIRHTTLGSVCWSRVWCSELGTWHARPSETFLSRLFAQLITVGLGRVIPTGAREWRQQQPRTVRISYQFSGCRYTLRFIGFIETSDTPIVFPRQTRTPTCRTNDSANGCTALTSLNRRVKYKILDILKNAYHTGQNDQRNR